MRTVHALLVGINRYQACRPLQGCGNDVARVEDLLGIRAGAGEEIRVRTLIDEQATRKELISAFETHLGAAGPGDSALFWFSGHGSLVRLPPPLEHLDPSGYCQSLVCHDSRTPNTPDLLDYELRDLISAVVARGAHVVAVLDSCHSAGATRTGADASGDAPTARWVPPAEEAPALRTLLPAPPGRFPDGARDPNPAGVRYDHVALAACQDEQQAVELGPAGRRYGVFTNALLEAIDRLGPGATYRELLTAARSTVENEVTHQVPALFPATDDIVDQPFLGGTGRPPGSLIVMRYHRGEWELNVGGVHGLPNPAQGEVRVAVHLAEPVREARVVTVRTQDSTVAPINWTPDCTQQYEMVLSQVPMPAMTVGVDPRDDDTAERLGAEIAIAGPGRTPSPHVRMTGPDDPAADVTVSGLDDDRIRIHAPAPEPLIGKSVADAVRQLEHIAGWRTVRNLRNRLSPFEKAIRIEILSPVTGEPLEPVGGTLHLAYAHVAGGWVPPTVQIRLHNEGDRPLYCVLLNLTDRYAINPDLFPGRKIAPGRHGRVLDGGLMAFQFPANRRVEPGASVIDRLQLLVSEMDFPARTFRLGPLGSAEEPKRRGPAAFAGILDRLGGTALERDGVPAMTAAPDWASTVLTIVTTVPYAA